MCGRYFVLEDDYSEIMKLPVVVESGFQSGEVFPTASAPILQNDMTIAVLPWGDRGILGGKSLLLHARAETVESKVSFRESFLYNRIMIPSSGFYEWYHQDGKSVKGEKYFFRPEDQSRLYMAGLAIKNQSGTSFVIITREAHGAMIGIHDRCPLMLHRKELSSWLHDEKAAKEILKRPQMKLSREYQGNGFAN